MARCVGEGGPGDMNLRVAFDVDGTLIDDQDNPRWEVIDLLRALHACGATIGIWSGGGADYARHWKERLNLREFVSWQAAKDSALAPVLDLVVDDGLEFEMPGVKVLIVVPLEQGEQS